VILFGGIKVG